MSTLAAGTVADFEGSLAERIEDAFAGELYAVKGTQLPETGVQERRILFCAIAQGVLAFLAANPAGLQLALTPSGGTASGGTVEVQAPTIFASGGEVSGSGWPAGTVTVTATAGGTSETVSVEGDGTITAILPAGASGVIDARDGEGNAAQVAI
jgi:hypothetical protein